MSAEIEKNNNNGVILSKGDICLVSPHQGRNISQVCIGLNWGSIHHKKFFGLFSFSEAVDLDASAAVFGGKSNSLLEQIYYARRASWDKSIYHSGDDLMGDRYGDDYLDNEVISVDLSKVSSSVTQIVFFLNSYKGQDFASIPYSKIRVYEGQPNVPNEILATYNLTSSPTFAGKVAVVMGKLYKEMGEWKFKSIGEPVDAQQISDTIRIIQRNYL